MKIVENYFHVLTFVSRYFTREVLYLLVNIQTSMIYLEVKS